MKLHFSGSYFGYNAYTMASCTLIPFSFEVDATIYFYNLQVSDFSKKEKIQEFRCYVQYLRNTVTNIFFFYTLPEVLPILKGSRGAGIKCIKLNNSKKNFYCSKKGRTEK